MKNILYRGSFVPLKPQFKHIFRIMKLAFMCLFVFVSGLFATEASSQTARVSIVANSISTKDLIREIEKQTEYLFVYNKNEVDLNQTVTINADNKTVAEILNKTFGNTDIVYAMEGSNIMLMKKESKAEVQASQQKEKTVNRQRVGRTYSIF